MGIGVVRSRIGVTEDFTKHARRGPLIKIGVSGGPQGETRDPTIQSLLAPAPKPHRGLSKGDDKQAHDRILGASRCSGFPATNNPQAKQGGAE